MAYGMYLLNPAKKRRRKSRRRVARRGKNRATKLNPTMKSRRRRRKARSSLRNPSRRRRTRRARAARTNPSRRRRSMRSARSNPSRRRRFSRRNPGSGLIAEFTSPDMLAVAGGLIAGTLGSGIIINKLTKPGSSLPGMDPAKPSPIARTLWKAGIPALIGYFLRGKYPRAAEGLMLSGVAILGTDLLAQSGALTKLNAAVGTSAYLGRRGANTYIPGVPPMLSGPATAFINNGAPVARRRAGMGAAVNSRWASGTSAGVPNPFKAN